MLSEGCGVVAATLTLAHNSIGREEGSVGSPRYRP